MTTSLAVILVLGALVLGILVGWLWHANRAARSGRSDELQRVQEHGELEVLRRDAAELRSRLAQAGEESDRRLAEQREHARQEADRRVAEAREQADRLLAQVREHLEEQLAEAKGDQEAAAQRF
ncbi:hypothetical protein ACFWEK_17815, partial [Isoptericola sp. NPDC060257]